MRRTGLGSRGGFDAPADDPLDGLVNLFDLGLVLAVAFLVAGLGLTVDAPERDRDAPTTPGRERTRAVAPPPADGPRAGGRGERLGTLYRLPDGRVVLVEPDAGTPTGATAP